MLKDEDNLIEKYYDELVNRIMTQPEIDKVGDYRRLHN